MSNGSVLVMGGVNGAGGAASASVEILPRIPGGDTRVFLDWLDRTNPNNLYPFVHILSSGSIFVGPSETPHFLPRIAVVDIP